MKRINEGLVVDLALNHSQNRSVFFSPEADGQNQGPNLI